MVLKRGYAASKTKYQPKADQPLAGRHY